jgi:hypothetical protein
MMTDDELWLQQMHLRRMKDDLFPMQWMDALRRETPGARDIPTPETMQRVAGFASDRELRQWIQTEAPFDQVIALYLLLLKLTAFLLIADDEPERREGWARAVDRERTARNAFAVAWRFAQDEYGFVR